MFDFEKTEKYLLNCLKAAELASKGQRVVVKFPAGYFFPMFDKHVKKHLKVAINEIRRDELVKTNLTEEEIRNEIEEILFRVFSVPKDHRSAVLREELKLYHDTVTNKLKKEIFNYSFILHINKLDLEENLTIGEVRFFKLDDNTAEQILSEDLENQYHFRC